MIIMLLGILLIAGVTGWVADQSGRSPWVWGGLAALFGLPITLLLCLIILFRGKRDECC